MIKEYEEYYQKKKKEFTKYINPDKKYKIDFSSNDNTALISVDGRIKLKVKYDIIGAYNISSSVWYWAWNITFIDKNLISNSIKVKEYYDKILTKTDKTITHQTKDKLHYILTNGNFYLSGKNLDKLLHLITYIVQSHWILLVPPNTKSSFIDNENIIKFISINEIVEVK